MLKHMQISAFEILLSQKYLIIKCTRFLFKHTRLPFWKWEVRVVLTTSFSITSYS